MVLFVVEDFVLVPLLPPQVIAEPAVVFVLAGLLEAEHGNLVETGSVVSSYHLDFVVDEVDYFVAAVVGYYWVAEDAVVAN